MYSKLCGQHMCACTQIRRAVLCCAVEIVLESDLVDSCKPGDRVAIVGIFRPLASANGGTTSGAYRCVRAHMKRVPCTAPVQLLAHACLHVLCAQRTASELLDPCAVISCACACAAEPGAAHFAALQTTHVLFVPAGVWWLV